MVTSKIASGCLDRIIDRLRPFTGRTTNVAFVAVPSAPHRPSFAFFDVYRIPDTPFSVIVLMDFLYRHRTSFRLRLSSRRTRAQTSSQFGMFTVQVFCSPFTVCGLRLGGSHGTETSHTRELLRMELMGPVGLINGSQQPLTGNGKLRTAL
jgi:hypothetical protein